MKANGKSTAQKIREIDSLRKGGMTATKAIEKLGISSPTYYSWKKKIAAGPRKNLFVTEAPVAPIGAAHLVALVDKTRQAIADAHPDVIMAALLLNRERGRA